MPKTLLLLMGLAGLAAIATCETPLRSQPAVPPPNNNILPPAEYDHEYKGLLAIEEVPDIETLLRTCRLPQRWALGCAMYSATSCHVYLVPEAVMKQYGWWREVMLRHEIGHCNGWPNDHPGARPPENLTVLE